MPAHLAYLATGRADIRTQALYAAYSALAWRLDADATVHVLTDEPGAFAPLQGEVTVEVLSPDQIASWCGPFEFVFRLKPKAVEHLLERYPGDKVVLVDADTFFVGPLGPMLDRIGPRRAAMHDREYFLGDASTRSYFHSNFCRRMTRARFRGVPVRQDTWMWNSGLVGLDPSHAPLVGEWIRFVDEVFPRNPKPMIEQYGLSFLLQERGDEISDTKDLVTHYWPDKRRYQAAIEAELSALTAMPLADALERVRRAPVWVDGPAPPWPKQPRVQRWRTSVRTRWLILKGLLRRAAGVPDASRGGGAGAISPEP